jgi:hypothetical protein
MAPAMPADLVQAPEAIDRCPIARGFDYRGTRVHTSTGVATFIRLLRCLWDDYPDKRNRIRSALNSSASFRFGMAGSPAELFPGKPAGWRLYKYCKLDEGVYVDINLSNATKRARLIAVVQSVGLLWDTDVRVHGI